MPGCPRSSRVPDAARNWNSLCIVLCWSESTPGRVDWLAGYKREVNHGYPHFNPGPFCCSAAILTGGPARWSRGATRIRIVHCWPLTTTFIVRLTNIAGNMWSISDIQYPPVLCGVDLMVLKPEELLMALVWVILEVGTYYRKSKLI